MGHSFNGRTITTRFEIVNGEICLVYSGNFHNDSYDVYRQFADGRTESRCLYCTSFGYSFSFPGEVISRSYYSGYYGQRQIYEEWQECCDKSFATDFFKKSDKEIICSVYPEFSYTIDKWLNSRKSLLQSSILKALRVWKKYPMVEMLLATKNEDIAFNKNFYKLSKPKQKEIISFIQNHKERYELQEIQTMLKYNVSPEELKTYEKKKHIAYNLVLSFPEYDYLIKTNQFTKEAALFYRDYKKMLKESGHNLKDKYWLFPKDIHAQHMKLMAEKEAKEALLLEEKNKKYVAKVCELFKYKSEVHGYSVFIPESLGEWSTQANALHQCILWAKYDEKILNSQNYCLVFIRKNGLPVATAEIIGKEKKIGQFYANEKDRDNCLPTEEVKKVLNEWLQNFSFAA